MLFFSEIYSFKESLQSEMEYVELFETIPSNLTYPLIQPKLFKKVLELNEKIQQSERK